MVLEFVANVDCPQCGTTYEGHWTDDSITVEDATDPPVGLQTCPGCGHQHEETYPGWFFHSEAG
jgi:hypothetical protein